jgi:DNA-binding response OmpR family regulator
VSRARVLVVDDDADIRKSLQRGLALAGFDVDTIGDSADADERLRTDRPDAVVLDVRMSPPDGARPASTGCRSSSLGVNSTCWTCSRVTAGWC